MTSEKSNGILNHPPIAYTTTQSPKWVAPRNGTTRIATPPTANVSSTRRREGRVDGSGAESGQLHEDVATPVKAFLSSNVTPRSGSRKARLESASSTPNGTASGTPNNVRPNFTSEKRETVPQDVWASSGLGLKISTSGRRSRASSVLSDGPGSSVSSRPPVFERRESATRMTSPESSPMFVYANDVKASMPSRPPVGRPLPKKQVSGYGQSDEADNSNGRNSSMSSSPTPDEQKPRFFHANITPNDTRHPARLSNSISSQRPPLQTIYSAHTASSPPRAASPLKEETLPRRSSLSKPSPRRHTRLVSNGGTEIRPPTESTFGNTGIARRSSTNSPRQSPRQAGVKSHSRSSSVQSARPSPRRRSSIALSNAAPTSAESNGMSSNLVSNGALPHSVNPPSATEEFSPPNPSAPTLSPTRSSVNGQSKIDQMNELAANARRERKVADLEISNSSLLTVNRTLEREMRKLNAELRRYRRLSKSGRLPAAPTSRSAVGNSSLLSEDAEDSADGNSLADSDDEENEGEDVLSGISSPSVTNSRPSSPTSRAGRTRFQDPKRPKLDLSAHRNLLLDSQKLNQSINRCLTQSESLITSGKTALVNHARASTPENLGGRVLTPDDDGDLVFGKGQGLLSPSPWTSGNPFEKALGNMGGQDGGLETPDYSKWGPSTEPHTPFAELGNSMASEKPKEAPATDMSDVQETTGENDNSVNAAAPHLLNRESKPASKPALTSRYSDSEISLDGIDDSLDSSSSLSLDGEGEPHHHGPDPPVPPLQPPQLIDDDDDDGEGQGHTDSLSRPSSPSRILYAMRPPDITTITKSESTPVVGNVPGNRGSMQNLGHYLQAFSFFGGGGGGGGGAGAGLKE